MAINYITKRLDEIISDAVTSQKALLPSEAQTALVPQNPPDDSYFLRNYASIPPHNKAVPLLRQLSGSARVILTQARRTSLEVLIGGISDFFGVNGDNADAYMAILTRENDDEIERRLDYLEAFIDLSLKLDAESRESSSRIGSIVSCFENIRMSVLNDKKKRKTYAYRKLKELKEYLIGIHETGGLDPSKVAEAINNGTIFIEDNGLLRDVIKLASVSYGVEGTVVESLVRKLYLFSTKRSPRGDIRIALNSDCATSRAETRSVLNKYRKLSSKPAIQSQPLIALLALVLSASPSDDRILSAFSELSIPQLLGLKRDYPGIIFNSNQFVNSMSNTYLKQGNWKGYHHAEALKGSNVTDDERLNQALGQRFIRALNEISPIKGDYQKYVEGITYAYEKIRGFDYDFSRQVNNLLRQAEALHPRGKRITPENMPEFGRHISHVGQLLDLALKHDRRISLNDLNYVRQVARLPYTIANGIIKIREYCDQHGITYSSNPAPPRR